MSEADLEQSTMRLVSLRLSPFLFILYVFNFLDRSNVSIAALQMNDELKFSSATFGLGAGIFFIGYALCEVPSNLILSRVGARLWITRIMITWGAIAAAMMWVRTPLQFYSMRFLLGVAEAGFFPGIIYYLSQWFPMAYRARATARFLVAIPLSQVLGGILGAVLLRLGGVGQLSGWQWLFLAEGVPSVLLGLMVLVYLTERPKDALWLSPEQRQWLSKRLDGERSDSAQAPHISPMRTLATPLVWILALPNFCYYTLGNGYIFWAPLLIRSALHTGDSATSIVASAIALLAVAAYFIAAAQSDRNGERCRYAAWGLALQAAGWIGAAVAPDSFLRVAALSLIPIGGAVFGPAFWCLPAMRFKGEAAATVIALIATVGSTGGFLGPTFVGFFKRATGSEAGSFIVLAGLGLVGSAIIIWIRRNGKFAAV